MADFDQQLQGLLGNPAFNLGVGLLSQAGPSPTPVNLGQAFSNASQFATEREKQQMQMQAARQSLQQQSQQQKAMSQLQGLLQNPAANVPASIRNPNAIADERQQMLGLLSQANPEAFTNSLIQSQFAQPQQPRVSADLNTFAALNPELEIGTPEFRQAFTEFQQNENLPQDLIEQTQLQLSMMELQNAREERERRESTEAQARRGQQFAAARGIRSVSNLADDLEMIQDTFLRPGVAMPNLRRDIESVRAAAQDILGQDSSQTRKVVAAYDRVNKGFNDLIIETIDRFGGNITNTQLETLANASASVDIAPEAAAKILADVLETIVVSSQIEELSVPNLDDAQETIKQLRRMSGASPVDPTEQRVIDFSDLPGGQ